MKSLRILFLLGVYALHSCESREDHYDSYLLGAWSQNSTVSNHSDWFYKNQIVFKNDGTYQWSLQMIENAEEEVVGYLSLTTGEYLVHDDRLLRFNIKQYGLDNKNEYLDREMLVFQGAVDRLPQIGIDFNFTLDRLELDFFVNGRICQGLCVEAQTFDREN